MVDIDEIHAELIEIASNRDTTFYSELRDKFEPGLNMLAFNNLYDPVFTQINNEEHGADRPLLSAVVINRSEEMPGAGFFENARRLGVHPGGDDRRFWEDELERVHNHKWK